MPKVQGLVDVEQVSGHLNHNLPGFQIPREATFSFTDPSLDQMSSFQTDYSHPPSSISYAIEPVLTRPYPESAPPHYFHNATPLPQNIPPSLFPVASRINYIIPSGGARPTTSLFDRSSSTGHTMYPVLGMIQPRECQFNSPDIGFSMPLVGAPMTGEIASRTCRMPSYANSGDRMYALSSIPDNSVGIKDLPRSTMRTFNNETAPVMAARKGLGCIDNSCQIPDLHAMKNDNNEGSTTAVADSYKKPSSDASGVHYSSPLAFDSNHSSSYMLSNSTQTHFRDRSNRTESKCVFLSLSDDIVSADLFCHRSTHRIQAAWAMGQSNKNLTDPAEFSFRAPNQAGCPPPRKQ